MEHNKLAFLGIVLAAVMLITGAALAAETGMKSPVIQCFMCGMDIHTDGNLHVKLVFKDGAIKYVDDLGEAAKALAMHKEHIARIVVFDHTTGKEIESQKAFALVGSKFKPLFQTMSPDQVLFFEKKADAEKALKKWSGRVATFDDAITALTAAKACDDKGPAGEKGCGCGGTEKKSCGHEGHH